MKQASDEASAEADNATDICDSRCCLFGRLGLWAVRHGLLKVKVHVLTVYGPACSVGSKTRTWFFRWFGYVTGPNPTCARCKR